MDRAEHLIEMVVNGSEARSVVGLISEASMLNKLPSNTDVNDMLKWSEWGGKLAMVDGPDYYRTNTDASGGHFNPATLSRKYTVRFATDLKGKRLDTPNKSYLGHKIVVDNRSAQWWETKWSIGKYGYGPVETGTFEKKVEEFWVAVKLKDLGKAEVREVAKLYTSYGYQDIGGYRETNLKQSAWKKILSLRKFSETQDLNPDMANAAYKLLLIANGNKDPRDETDEQIVWDSIQGIYKTSKHGDSIAFIMKK
jgi:hypothetical protein